MNRFAIPLVAGAVVFLGSAALGQETAGIPKEIIKELEGFVGTWQIEGKIGDRVETGTYTCWWGRTADNKKVCLVGRFSNKSGESTRSGMNLIGWNSVRKCIEDRGFDAKGGNATIYWTPKSEKEWQGEVIMVVNGQEIKSKETLIKKGPFEIVTESESGKGGVSRYVFKKVSEKPKR